MNFHGVRRVELPLLLSLVVIGCAHHKPVEYVIPVSCIQRINVRVGAKAECSQLPDGAFDCRHMIVHAACIRPVR